MKSQPKSESTLKRTGVVGLAGAETVRGSGGEVALFFFCWGAAMRSLSPKRLFYAAAAAHKGAEDR